MHYRSIQSATNFEKKKDNNEEKPKSKTDVGIKAGPPKEENDVQKKMRGESSLMGSTGLKIFRRRVGAGGREENLTGGRGKNFGSGDVVS